MLLVAVAIVVSVTVTLWVVNIAFHHTGFELLDVSCRGGEGHVILLLRNRGSRPVTVLAVVFEEGYRELGLTLKPGEAHELALPVDRSGAVQVEVRTPGKSYPCVTAIEG